MGYTTEFGGQFAVNPPLTRAQVDYLQRFSETRRMGRDSAVVSANDPVRVAVGLPVGDWGQYYVGGDDASVINYNTPPPRQPGLWCQWVPTSDGKHLEWDGGEKFYAYVEWLAYVVEHFLQPWGRALSGEVRWQGEEIGDSGVITASDGLIRVDPANGAPRIIATKPSFFRDLGDVLAVAGDPAKRRLWECLYVAHDAWLEAGGEKSGVPDPLPWAR